MSELLKDTGNFEIRRVDIVGPKVGDELRKRYNGSKYITYFNFNISSF